MGKLLASFLFQNIFFSNTDALVKWTTWIITPVAPFQKCCAYKLILEKLDLFSACYSYLSLELTAVIGGKLFGIKMCNQCKFLLKRPTG